MTSKWFAGCWSNWTGSWWFKLGANHDFFQPSWREPLKMRSGKWSTGHFFAEKSPFHICPNHRWWCFGTSSVAYLKKNNGNMSHGKKTRYIPFGQFIIESELRPFSGGFPYILKFTKPPFGVTFAEVVTNCPDSIEPWLIPKVMSWLMMKNPMQLCVTEEGCRPPKLNIQHNMCPGSQNTL